MIFKKKINSFFPKQMVPIKNIHQPNTDHSKMKIMVLKPESCQHDIIPRFLSLN